jgi:aminoglycoside phosphotransferase (APT) family kinase protein
VSRLGLGRRLAEGREAEVFAFDGPDLGEAGEAGADGDGGGSLTGQGATVLKLLRRGGDGARVEREAAALRALEAEGYPAPRAVRSVTVEGRPGLVLERVDGRDQLAMIGRRPLSVFRAGRVMGEVHVTMHDCAAPPGLPELHDELRVRIEAAEILPDDLRSEVLAMLDGLPRGDQLCHGDLHPGNILGAWDRPVVIDWADAARGDPVADVARSTVLLTAGEAPPGSPTTVRMLAPLGRRILHDRYLATYRSRRPVDPDLLRRWQVVRAAGRLWEPVPDEHPALLRLVSERLGR